MFDISEEELHLKRCAEILTIAECSNKPSDQSLLTLDAALTQINGDWKTEDEANLFYGVINWREEVEVVEGEGVEDEDPEYAILLYLYCGSERNVKLCIRRDAKLAHRIYINTVLKVCQVKGKELYHREIEVL